MRRLVLGVIVALLSCDLVRAQNAVVPALQRVIDTDFEVRLPIHECSVPDAVKFLARRLRFPAGVEYLPGICTRLYQGVKAADRLNLRGLSVSDGLGKLIALDPRYHWIDSDGVVVVRPADAWADPKNLLNFKTSSFALEGVNLGAALDAVASALHGKQRLDGDTLANRTEQGSRLFSVKTGPTSAGGVMDAIVRAHGDMWWELQDFDADVVAKGRRMLWFYTFDGSGLGTAVWSATR